MLNNVSNPRMVSLAGKKSRLKPPVSGSSINVAGENLSNNSQNSLPKIATKFNTSINIDYYFHNRLDYILYLSISFHLKHRKMFYSTNYPMKDAFDSR